VGDYIKAAEKVAALFPPCNLVSLKLPSKTIEKRLQAYSDGLAKRKK
jgi:hypothetical protein